MKTYKFLRKDRASISIPEDVEVCYDFIKCDYGCAGDDSRFFGMCYTAVTLDPRGDSPFFTIPEVDLESNLT